MAIFEGNTLEIKTENDIKVQSPMIATETVAEDYFQSSNIGGFETYNYDAHAIAATAHIGKESSGSLFAAKTPTWSGIYVDSDVCGFETLLESEANEGISRVVLTNNIDSIPKGFSLKSSFDIKDGNLTNSKTKSIGEAVESEHVLYETLNISDISIGNIKNIKYEHGSNISFGETKNSGYIKAYGKRAITSVLKNVVPAQTPELTNLLLFKDSSKQIKTFDVINKSWVSLNSKTSSQNKFLSKGIEDPKNLVQNTSKEYKSNKEVEESSIFKAKIEFEAFKTITSIKPISL
jgi:hypothetical protein